MLMYWIWFAELIHVPAEQKQLLLQHFSDPEEIYYSDEKVYKSIVGITEKTCKALENKDLADAHKILQDCTDLGLGIITLADDMYPHKLRNIFDPPVVLYYKGILPDWEKAPVIGIVGTRKASAYGLQSALRLSTQIAQCGGLVVSGGAFGVDTMAMQGALRAEKPVVGVLGCGLDVVYPKSNKLLFSQIVETGCLISEYPPKTPPYSWNFPVRNRIISGLCNGVLVVEAPASSGALITARQAWEQGRDVFVVPGNIDVESCAGSNELLQQGAIPALSGWNVIREYEALYPGVVKQVERPPLHREKETMKVAQTPRIPEISKTQEPVSKKIIDNREKSPYSVLNKKLSALSAEEQEIAELLTDKPQEIDEILAKTDLPPGTALSILTRLVLKGIAKNHPGRRMSLQ